MFKACPKLTPFKQSFIKAFRYSRKGCFFRDAFASVANSPPQS